MIYDPFEVVNCNAESNLILTCEHASSEIPAEYNNLGLSELNIKRHIAKDKGSAELTTKLAEQLGCSAVMGKYSRLLIDLDRREEDPELIVDESDKTLIPGNLELSEDEKNNRIVKFYRPYYKAVNEQVARIKKLGKKPILVSVHSYTPQLRGGTYRPWQAGILHHKPQELSTFLYEELKNKQEKKVGQNVTYDWQKYHTGTAVAVGENHGLDYAVIEIRDSEFADLEQGCREWADILRPMLQKYMQKTC